jgi:hypothetical protein
LEIGTRDTNFFHSNNNKSHGFEGTTLLRFSLQSGRLALPCALHSFDSLTNVFLANKSSNCTLHSRLLDDSTPASPSPAPSEPGTKSGSYPNRRPRARSWVRGTWGIETEGPMHDDEILTAHTNALLNLTLYHLPVSHI